MKTIIIKSIALLNFKGVRELSLDFDERDTTIAGRNGSGKTTVFDAFTWLLFGKDSQDRKLFDIKTLDAQGNIIQQIPHEVSAVIEVNGTEMRLMRRFTEKWVKRAGQTCKVFTGNVEERYINDVPMTKAEYEQKIAEICSEQVFKFITSPTYFCSQKPDAQKAMLMRMAGDVSDAEIADGNSDFQALLEAITGKTLEEFKREIGAKKRRLNADIIELPGRIDEKKRELVGEEDWTDVEQEIAKARTERTRVQQMIESAAALHKERQGARMKLTERVSELRIKRQQREAAITAEVMQSYYQRQSDIQKLKYEISQLTQSIANNERIVSDNQRDVKRAIAARETLVAEWKQLNAQAKSVKLEQLNIDENAFICPTCRRPLEPDQIEAKQAEMLANFEEGRSRRLAEIAQRITENVQTGKATKLAREKYECVIADTTAKIDALKKQIADINARPELTESVSKPDATDAIAKDEEIAGIDIQIDALTRELDNAPSEPQDDNAALKAQRDALNAHIEELSATLAKRDVNADTRKRIGQLEKQLTQLNQELAELERMEFTMSEFSKARSEAIQQRINHLFKLVRFRWIATAVNGAETETCEATINGVPYQSLNHAGQILAGLDIINAICQSEDVAAPIVIDNSEAINDNLLPTMRSQLIKLKVSEDTKLTITK